MHPPWKEPRDDLVNRDSESEGNEESAARGLYRADRRIVAEE
jgi:hypothetical protein